MLRYETETQAQTGAAGFPVGNQNHCSILSLGCFFFLPIGFKTTKLMLNKQHYRWNRISVKPELIINHLFRQCDITEKLENTQAKVSLMYSSLEN